MKKIITLFLIVSVVCNLFCGCSNKKDSYTISEWDLEMISYFDGWDKKVPTENYIVGIIDVDSVVKSDDGTSEIKHSELLECVVKRISTKCKTKTITMPSTPSTDNFMSALSEMIDSGVKVINVSLGTTNEIQFSDEISKKIKENEVIVVCAAANPQHSFLWKALQATVVIMRLQMRMTWCSSSVI